MSQPTGTDPFPVPVDEREIIEARRTEKSQPDIETKPDIDEFVEDTDQKRQQRDVEYTAEEDGKPRKGLRRLLTRNPSMEFVREVAEMDQHPLNPVDVKRVCHLVAMRVRADVRQVERKLFWLIVPALCVDYMFYYIDKTSVSPFA
jgi:hypothetical protein